jgi:hypothetical protein
MIAILLGTRAPGFGQTSTTGALVGTAQDTTKGVLPGVSITIVNEASSQERTAVSADNGAYTFPLLIPGSYRLEATLMGFKKAVRSGIRVSITETTRLDIPLELGDLEESVTVQAAPMMVQMSTSALGRVVDELLISRIPMVSRNFTQILALSPGITTDVTNAAELGRGSGGIANLSRTSVGGSRGYDNNFQFEGLDVNDYQSSEGGNSPGTAIPSPDAIQEFKVQTAQADASFGRNAGANINVITKSGSNDFHGSLFEFFRNEKLNAQDYFFKLTDQPKPIVRQNQFGGTAGGPLWRDKLFVFFSYQGTRQRNGLAAGKVNAKCSATVPSPPLTDDRSAAALGAMFAGRAGRNGGVAIRADGSNINPVALNLLQMKLPDGSYLLGTPQSIDTSLPFDQQGLSVLSEPCTFNENQELMNVDYQQTRNSRFSGRIFYAKASQFTSFASANANTFGAPVTVPSKFRVMTLAHSYVLASNIFNDIRIGGFMNPQSLVSSSAFQWPDIGVFSGATNGAPPFVTITGSYVIGPAQFIDFPQGNWSLTDNLSYVRGNHSFRVGGGVTRLNSSIARTSGTQNVTFLSFPDFLLGMDAASNGSLFSNVAASSYSPFDRIKLLKLWDGFGYIQDDITLGPRLTVNLGLRYERFGHPTDDYHINTNFDPGRANPNPPAGGTLAGYLVPADWQALVLPGIEQLPGPYGTDTVGQNKLAPRIGVAWKPLPGSERVVVRGGWGQYYTHSVGISQVIMGSQAFGAITRGTANGPATFQNPFVPIDDLNGGPNSFLASQTYTPTTTKSTTGLAMDYQPARIQQYSVNTQIELANNYLLEVGYVGSRGTHVSQGLTPNQALMASPANPVRGATTNTLANLQQRVPIQGFLPSGITMLTSDGSSWYDSLQTSFTKRMSRGLQMLTSYTWSRSIDSNAGRAFQGGRAGGAPGDQHDPEARKGPSELSREHRLVISSVYDLPSPASDGVVGKVFGRWALSGVGTFQSGSFLSVLLTNSTNVGGIVNDRAQLVPGCAGYYSSGSLTDRLNQYFNTACFTTPPVVGEDGRATAFGNSPVGVVTGPGQFNVDLSIQKTMSLGSSRRAEFQIQLFNLLNTAQFANPDTNFSSSTFGQIRATSVNPRMGQLALKFVF